MEPKKGKDVPLAISIDGSGEGGGVSPVDQIFKIS